MTPTRGRADALCTKSTTFVASPVAVLTRNNVLALLAPYSVPSGAKAKAMRNPENPEGSEGSRTPVDPIREARPVSRFTVYRLLKAGSVELNWPMA